MRVLLVVPPSYRFGGGAWLTFHLGLGYVASALRSAGHTVRIYDTNIIRDASLRAAAALDPAETMFANYEAALRDAAHPVWREVEENLRMFAPDVVGVTLKIVDLRGAIRIAQIAKASRPDC